jgi:lantibiotic modifying enzyme
MLDQLAMADYISQLLNDKNNENVISFTRDYLNEVNKDIIFFLKLLLKNRDKERLTQVKLHLAQLYHNHENYFEEVLSRTGKGFVRRLGDPHNNGRSTVMVEQFNGKIVYKPINLDMLSLLYKYLNILNLNGCFKFFSVPIIKKENDYSIVKFVNNEEHQNMKEFCFHYGALLFVITTLRGLDIHRENVFCINSTPVIIDCESLFYPVIKSIKSYDVTATSMIPTEHHVFTPIANLQVHTEQLIAGIELSYKIFLDNKIKFLEVIDEGLNKQTRMIFKPTKYYYSILRNSTHPNFLLDSEKRKEYIVDSLISDHPISKAIINCEVAELMKFSIPYFYFYEGKLFGLNGKEIIQNFITSPKEEIIRSIGNIKSFKESLITAIRAIK